jgi:hypothetical protein
MNIEFNYKTIPFSHIDMLKNVFLIGFLFSVIAISGCLGTSSDNYASPTDENRAWTSNPIPVSTTTPSQQYIITGKSGNHRISANEVIVSGSCNNIKILNDDILRIILSGNDNNVAYPEGARPLISNGGTNNNIGAFKDVLSVPQTGCYGSRN